MVSFSCICSILKSKLRSLWYQTGEKVSRQCDRRQGYQTSNSGWATSRWMENHLYCLLRSMTPCAPFYIFWRIFLPYTSLWVLQWRREVEWAWQTSLTMHSAGFSFLWSPIVHEFEFKSWVQKTQVNKKVFSCNKNGAAFNVDAVCSCRFSFVFRSCFEIVRILLARWWELAGKEMKMENLCISWAQWNTFTAITRTGTHGVGTEGKCILQDRKWSQGYFSKRRFSALTRKGQCRAICNEHRNVHLLVYAYFQRSVTCRSAWECT